MKETAAFRILLGGEDLHQVLADLDTHNRYSLRTWVSNQQLTQLLPEAKLLLLARTTMIEVAEQELKIPIRKKVWHQTGSRLRSYDLAQVRVGRLGRLCGVSRQAFYRKEQ